jgi:hypothetical protein
MILPRIRPLLFAFLVLFAAGVRLKGDDKPYFPVGEIVVPGLMGTVNDFSAFAEKVKPGTSMMFAGGAMALSFKFPGFDFNSGIRVIGYADAKDPLKKSHYAVILTPSGAAELKDRVKVGKKTLFVKELNGKALLSDSMDFLNTFKALPKLPNLTSEIKGVSKNKKPALYIKSMPALFFQKAGDSLPSIKSLMASAHGSLSIDPNADASKKSASENAMEIFFKQCATIETRVYASQKALIVHFTLSPTPGSKFQAALKPLKGEMTTEVLDDVVSQTIGDPQFRLSKKFKKAIDLLSKEAGGKVDAKNIISKLPKLLFSAKDSRMLVEFDLSPDVLRTALLDGGVIQEPEKDDSAPSSSDNSRENSE